MCCFLASLFFFGPRLAFLVYWLFPVGQVRVAVAFDTWFWPLLGFLFLPWTFLMYVLIFPAYGFDWFFIGLAFLADMAGYFGGYRTRQQVPYYTGP